MPFAKATENSPEFDDRGGEGVVSWSANVISIYRLLVEEKLGDYS